MADRGDVLRLLGAEVSIAAQLVFQLLEHCRCACGREVSRNDASKSLGSVSWCRGLSEVEDECFV
jgi:hypothetical protein